jgi:pyruvate kinase
MLKRRAKIVCTLGPATASEEKIEALIGAGVNVIRLNFSHGCQEEHGKAIQQIRLLSEKKGRPVAILQDLQGSKIRIGPLKEPLYRLKKGAAFTLLSRPVIGDSEGASTNYPRLFSEVAAGDTILINDGLIALSVRKIHNQQIHCRVIEGGLLEPNKGVSVPGKASGMPALTLKDRNDLAFGLSHGVDFVALSMVQDAKVVLSVKQMIKKAGKSTAVIAKLERAVAIQNLDAILKASDGVMVARGDLGVDLPPEQVPVVQKEIIRRANLTQTPVITATQMLESMVTYARPTRAEASDVANAVFDGTDALMLSAETATGTHPIEAVQMMDRIIMAVQQELPVAQPTITPGLSVSEAISKAACLLAIEMNAKAIVTSTLSGKAALRLSTYRPPIPIIAFTPSAEIERRMSLYWGVESRLIPMYTSGTDLFKEMIKGIQLARLAKKGDLLVLVSQSQKSETMPTDSIKIVKMP